MKISIFYKQDKRTYQRIQESCKKYWVELINSNTIDPNNIINHINNLWDVVIYKSDPFAKNHFYYKELLSKLILSNNKIIINKWNFHRNFLYFKYYQQKFLETKYPEFCIWTYIFDDVTYLENHIKSNILNFPVICKPNVWTRWEWIFVLKDFNDIKNLLSNENISKYVFQNFIKNDWDYRIIIVWEKVIWIMKRIWQNGSMLNNISQWWIWQKIENKKIWEIALKISKHLELDFVWIDIIYDESTKKYLFLESNSYPQRQWFENIYNNINVSDELVKYCCDSYQRLLQ